MMVVMMTVVENERPDERTDGRRNERPDERPDGWLVLVFGVWVFGHGSILLVTVTGTKGLS